MSYVRDLTAADLARLANALPTTIPPLKKMRATHHKQAQLLALGHKPTEVARVCGTTPSRLSVLQNDPTFSELISYYQSQQSEVAIETHKRVQETLVDVLELAANEIQERLSDDTKLSRLDVSELRKIAEFAADRTVAPPRATQQGSTLPPTKISLNFGFVKKESKQEKLLPDATIIDVESDER
jgi:hypothetical protein